MNRRPENDISKSPEDVFLSDEAKADSAPVGAASYHLQRNSKDWMRDYNITTLNYPARLKWPKKRDAKAFFERINRAGAQ